MKKLICLMMLISLVVGCSSKPTNEDKTQEDKKITENSKEEVSKKDDVEETQEEKKDSVDESKSEITENASDTTEQSKPSHKSNTTNNESSSSGGEANNTESVTPTPPKQETPPPAPAIPTEQRAKADGVMAQINSYRQQNGKPAFIVTNYLLDKSSNHAYAMAEQRALWHSGAAECITNYDDPFNAWVNSPEHNKLLLSNNETGAVSIYYVDGYYFSVFQTLP